MNDIEFRNLYFCYYERLVTHPLRLGFMFLMVFQELRYFFIKNIHKHLSDIKKLHQKNDIQALRRFKIFKFLSSGWSLLILLLIVVLSCSVFWAGTGFIQGAIEGVIFVCPAMTNLRNVGQLITFLILVIYYIILLLLVGGIIAYDGYMNRELIKNRKWKELFVYSDPFYFRIEFAVEFTIFFFFVIFGIVMNVTTEQSNQFIREFSTVLVTGLYINLQVGILLGVTIYWDHKKKKPLEDDEFEKIMTDKRVFQLFYKFAQQEWYEKIIK